MQAAPELPGWLQTSRVYPTSESLSHPGGYATGTPELQKSQWHLCTQHWRSRSLARARPVLLPATEPLP